MNKDLIIKDMGIVVAMVIQGDLILVSSRVVLIIEESIITNQEDNTIIIMVVMGSIEVEIVIIMVIGEWRRWSDWIKY
jgi:hypothetical protein